MYKKKGPFTAPVATGAEMMYCGRGICVKGIMSPAGKAIMNCEICSHRNSTDTCKTLQIQDQGVSEGRLKSKMLNISNLIDSL